MGIVSIDTARRAAEDKALDLLMVSPDAKPPVCRIMDFGQFRYEQQKKEKNAKKHVKNHVLKELKLSPKISEHDYQVRLSAGIKFLEKGYKVKVTLFFKGREMAHPELGQDLINRFVTGLSHVGVIENAVQQSHRSLLAVINPK